MVPTNQSNGMLNSMYQGAAPQRQTQSCTQMMNIGMRNMQNPAASTMPAQTATTGSTMLPPPGPETPSTVQSPYYTAGFLRNFVGCNMRVEFLLGTSGALVDRVGVLMEVGASYIVIQPFQTDDLLMCDLFSIKFVTIYG